ncbi:signal peptidase I [Nocardioides terrisoli]|uniref:signal peptidase I n=1 Tax=Nocardioides terrisoli TaxID=3388267 RepID=UPI00287B8380|nr:signal peptidase I [Nocardioides marmorisolisilvae]
MELTATRNPRRGRTRRVLVNVASILVTLAAIAFIAPAAFGLHRYVIAGESMTGTYDLGSVVLDKVVPVSDLRVGDVITYLPPADSGIPHLVTHRIVRIHGDVFRTKGDANPDPDPWTFKLTGATQARVVFGVPYAGWPLLALQDRTTRMAVIGIPALLVALSSARDLFRGLRRRKGSSPSAPTSAAAPAPVALVPRSFGEPIQAQSSAPRHRVGT